MSYLKPLILDVKWETQDLKSPRFFGAAEAGGSSLRSLLEQSSLKATPISWKLLSVTLNRPLNAPKMEVQRGRRTVVGAWITQNSKSEGRLS